MPRSARPRKKYRPSFEGKFIGREKRDRVMQPAHVALLHLRTHEDQAVLREAWHDLVMLFEAWRQTCADRPAVVAAIDAGSAALDAMWKRNKQLGSWRPSGPELIALEDAVTTCDKVQAYLRTDQVSKGLRDLMRRLDKAE